ncbi:MAG TPA: DsrE family protein [Methanosarcina sp.]|nr:DsrE family protein [Methanosarcina sp.]
MKTLTILLTDGPYISEYAEIAYKLAEAALKKYRVNIFLYLDAVHIPKKGQNPSFFSNTGELFSGLAEKGVIIRACARCAAARGYLIEENRANLDEIRVEALGEDFVEGKIVRESNCKDYFPGIRITSLYELSEMLSKSDKVISLSR